jgi:hypothetical protein
LLRDASAAAAKVTTHVAVVVVTNVNTLSPPSKMAAPVLHALPCATILIHGMLAAPATKWDPTKLTVVTTSRVTTSV